MIKHDTAARIVFAYDEITAAKTLMKELREANMRQQGLQLGVPMGNSSHRIMDVSPRLAEIIIQAHIYDTRSEIAALNEVARHELDSADEWSPHD